MKYILVFLLLVAPVALAGEADVLDARAIPSENGTYRFDVTLQHADTGWEHYADAWDILTPDGTLLGTRVLLHPHVGEQPFTCSLADVVIPADAGSVTVRGHDSVHSYGGREFKIDLPR